MINREYGIPRHQQAVLQHVSARLKELSDDLTAEECIVKLCKIVDEYQKAFEIINAKAQKVLGDFTQVKAGKGFEKLAIELARVYTNMIVDEETIETRKLDRKYMYFYQHKRILDAMQKWQDEYLGRFPKIGRLTANHEDRKNCIAYAQSLVTEEYNSFVQKCSEMKENIRNEYAVLHSATSMKKEARDQVDSNGRDKVVTLRAALENLPLPLRDHAEDYCSPLINKMREIEESEKANANR